MNRGDEGRFFRRFRDDTARTFKKAVNCMVSRTSSPSFAHRKTTILAPILGLGA
jgi:hypothetical protein